MLKKIGIYNDVSPSLIPELPEKGTIVFYKFLHVYHNPIKSISGRLPGKTDGIHYQYCRKMPVVSNFWDSKKEKFVPIGLIDAIDQNGTITRQARVYFNPMENHGFFTLTIGESAESDRLWTYLEMASFVEHDDEEWRRDESEELIMRKVDNEKEAKRQRDKRNVRKHAMDMAYNMTDEEIVRTALIIPFDVNQSIENVRNLVEDHAEKNPELFLRQTSDPDAEYKATIAQALSLNVMFVDRERGNLCYTQTSGVIMTLNSLEDVNNQFAAWMRDPANKLSEGHMKNIKMMIDAASKGKKRGRPALEKA